MTRETFEKLLTRIQELADMPMETLHASNPDITTDSRSDCVRASREARYSRGDLLHTIIEDEFKDDVES